MLAAALAALTILGEPVQDQAGAPELERRHLRGRYAGLRLLPSCGCLDLVAS